MRMGHSRSTAAVIGMTALASFVAYYLHWVFWFGVHAIRGDESFAEALVLLFPPFLLEAIGSAHGFGTWSLRSSEAVTGWPLTIVWLIEAVLFFGTAAVVAFTQTADAVYCEGCSKWCSPRPNVHRYEHTQGPTLASRLQGGDLAAVRESPEAPPNSDAWHQLDLVLCESCGATNTLSLLAFRNEYDKKGNVTQKSDIVVDRLLVTREQAQWVMEPRPTPTADTPWGG